MSLVADFMKAGEAQAFPIIGVTSFRINGITISGIASNLVYGKSYEGYGNAPVKSMTIVYLASLLSYRDLLKKTVEILSGELTGEILRVESADPDNVFVTLKLEQAEKA